MANVNLTLQQKLDMIACFEKERPDLQDLASRFNVGKTQAATIIRNREDILKNKHKKEPHEQHEPKRRGFFNPQGKIIDTTCYEWYLNCVKEQKNVSGKLIKEKAKTIARTINYKGFCASNGWLQKWRVRHNVYLKPLLRGQADASVLLHEPKANGTYLEANQAETTQFKKNAVKVPVKRKKFEVKLQNLLSKKPKKSSLDGVDNEESNLDPLTLTKCSYDKTNAVDDDDGLIIDGDSEEHFKIDSFESALNVIEDLKNFSQDDDVALKYLNLIESHFQKERLK